MPPYFLALAVVLATVGLLLYQHHRRRSRIGEPHDVIPDFLDWEPGDVLCREPERTAIDCGTFEDTYVVYIAADPGGVFVKGRYGDTETTGYLTSSDASELSNLTLPKRRKEQLSERLQKRANNSYNDRLRLFKEELRRLNEEP